MQSKVLSGVRPSRPRVSARPGVHAVAPADEIKLPTLLGLCLTPRTPAHASKGGYRTCAGSGIAGMAGIGALDAGTPSGRLRPG